MLGAVLYTIATGLGVFALFAWMRTNGEGGDGSAGPYVASLLTAAGALFFAYHGSLSLLAIDSRPLGRRTLIAGLLLGLLPYALLLGLPGFAVNAAFLLVAGCSGLGLWLRRSRA